LPFYPNLNYIIVLYSFGSADIQHETYFRFLIIFQKKNNKTLFLRSNKQSSLKKTSSLYLNKKNVSLEEKYFFEENNKKNEIGFEIVEVNSIASFP